MNTLCCDYFSFSTTFLKTNFSFPFRNELEIPQLKLIYIVIETQKHVQMTKTKWKVICSQCVCVFLLFVCSQDAKKPRRKKDKVVVLNNVLLTFHRLLHCHLIQVHTMDRYSRASRKRETLFIQFAFISMRPTVLFVIYCLSCFGFIS